MVATTGFEIWMMQAGPDLYRRLLAALPSGMNIATGLMLVANMSPDDVESLMFDLVEAPHVATVRLRQVGHAL